MKNVGALEGDFEDEEVTVLHKQQSETIKRTGTSASFSLQTAWEIALHISVSLHFQMRPPAMSFFKSNSNQKILLKNLPITPEVKGMIVYADEPGRLSWKEFDSFVSQSHYNVITALKKADRG